MEQRLAGKKLKVWQGCLLVVLVAVFLFAAQFVLTFVQYALTYFRILPAQTAYTIASVAYWLFGGFLGLRFLRDYVLNYLYTTNTKQLQVCRVSPAPKCSAPHCAAPRCPSRPWPTIPRRA